MFTHFLSSLYANNVQQIPHNVQQIMSSESQPILSRAVPAFELFMSAWEKLGDDNKRIDPFIQVGLYWANRYYGRMDNTRAYVIAMCKSLSLLAL